MQCSACHEPIAVWVAFCPHCGARQGAEAESASPTTSATHEPTPGVPATEAIETSDAGAESSLTAELFGESADPAPAAATAPLEQTQPPAYAEQPASRPPAPPAFTPPAYTQSQTDPDWQEWEEEEPPRRGAAPWLIGAAAALVILTLGFVVWSMLRVTDSGEASNSPNATTSTSPRATPGQSSPAASPSTSATQGSPSPSSSPTAPAGVPAGAISCGTSGTGDAAAVYAADANTSCPFALAVGDAYRAANSGGAPASITAKSPVTGKDYNLVCSGSVPTTCQADTGATVYLTRAG